MEPQACLHCSSLIAMRGAGVVLEVLQAPQALRGRSQVMVRQLCRVSCVTRLLFWHSTANVRLLERVHSQLTVGICFLLTGGSWRLRSPRFGLSIVGDLPVAPFEWHVAPDMRVPQVWEFLHGSVRLGVCAFC